MNINELHTQLELSLTSGDVDSSLAHLLRFHGSGGEQRDAYDVLEQLRTVDSIQEDVLLDIMDIVAGWCRPSRRIWHEEMRTGILLFEVQGYEPKAGRLGLLPGVPQALIARCELGGIRQGDEIDLHLPNGDTITTHIEDYYVRVPICPSEEFDVQDAPLIICLPSSLTHEDIPIGTCVWFQK